jgi:ketosteroid isomerase-like protein
MNDQRFPAAGSTVPPAAGRETRDAGAPGGRSDETQAVVERFTVAWAHPQLERFMELLHPDVLLLQPVTRPIHGRDAARAEFSRLLRWLPDLRGTVDQSAVRDAVALIAWRLAFTLGRRPYELRIVDRLVVSDGLIREREAYYDSLRLMGVLLRRPRSWPGYWWYRGFLPGSW